MGRNTTMKLKGKMVLVVGITVFLFLTLLYIIIRPSILEDSVKFDKSNVQKELETINHQIQSKKDTLNRTNRDWAVWDETYYYLQGENPEYVGVNLQDDTFDNNLINYMIFLDSENHLVDQKGYDYIQKKPIELGSDFYQIFLPILSSDKMNSSQLVMSDLGLTMNSIRSVYKSNGKGESAGTLIMGKMVNASFIKRLGEGLSLDLSFKQVKPTNSHLTNVTQISEKKIKGSFYIKDYSEKETFEISFISNRDFYIQKKSSIKQLSKTVLFTGLFFILLITVLLNQFILSRVQGLSFQLMEIQENKKVNSRIKISKGHKDELTDLEHSINRMLTSLEEKHNEIVQLAYYDQLTLIPNRYSLFRQFTRITAAYEGKLAILFFDLDGFKKVNDSMGHKTGDALLQSVCERVLPIIKQHNGIMARYGGDEFIILLKYHEKSELESFIEKLLQEVGKEYLLSTYKASVTASIGVSSYPQDGQMLEQLLQKADIALHEAKKNGKNQFVFYQDLTTNRNYINLLELENDLKFALGKNQFEIYYQTIVCGKSHRISGVEALLRWHHPDKGMISPAVFIPIAEETGLMPAIGEWVLVEAVKQISELHQKGFEDLTLSVNVSKSQMKDSRFIRKLDQVLTESNFPPSLLQIEITESDVNNELAEIQRFSHELKKRKVKLALDDFGVGTSALVYLKELPIDVIKIDRNFIKNVPSETFDTLLLSGIFEVITGLNLEVVIEGVESEEQLDYISFHFNSMIQGFYFSRPMPFTILEKEFFELEKSETGSLIS
ncbi:EAL domain-containing protein [Neobacillus sp. K501]